MTIDAIPLCFGYHYHVVDKPTNWALVREHLKSKREKILDAANKWAARGTDTIPQHNHDRAGLLRTCSVCGCDASEG